MKYKLLEEQDLELMLDFVDDENTKYNVDVLKKFIERKNQKIRSIKKYKTKNQKNLF